MYCIHYSLHHWKLGQFPGSVGKEVDSSQVAHRQAACFGLCPSLFLLSSDGLPVLRVGEEESDAVYITGL